MDPREPHDIAQQIIDDDADTMEELLKDTEVEDTDVEEMDFEMEPMESDEDDIEYF